MQPDVNQAVFSLAAPFGKDGRANRLAKHCIECNSMRAATWLQCLE